MPQGGGGGVGGKRVFLGDLKLFGKGQGEFTKVVNRRRGAGGRGS